MSADGALRMLTDTPDNHSYSPNAMQIRDAYSQLSQTRPPSASGSNSLPLPTPEQLAARKLQQSSHPRVKRARKGYIDCGGYMIPRPPAPPIGGRESGENRGFAEELKSMLDNEGVECHDEVDQDPVDGVKDVSTASQTPEQPTDQPAEPTSQSLAKMTKSKLEEAFQNEYYRVHRSGQQDYSALPVLAERGAVHPWLDASKLPPPVAKRPKRKNHALTLPGIDLKRQRNRYGRGHAAGQEAGVGVIGSNIASDDQANGEGPVIQLLTGTYDCDGPSYTFETYNNHKRKSLDPDMLPLAVEHPARVWNSLIQSLPPDLQPIIKWSYDKTQLDAQVPGWMATLSLALPPTHPALVNHPLSITLPKNKYAKEYLKVMELLGGSRTWSGKPRRLKADATNVTLVKCMGEGGLEWLRDPASFLTVVDSDVDDYVSDDDEGVAGQSSDQETVTNPTEPASNPDAIICDDVEVLEEEARPSLGERQLGESQSPSTATGEAGLAIGVTAEDPQSSSAVTKSNDHASPIEMNPSPSSMSTHPDDNNEHSEEGSLRPFTAYDELVQHVEKAREESKTDISIKTVVTTRSVSETKGSRSEPSKTFYGAFVFLLVENGLWCFGVAWSSRLVAEDAIKDACRSGLASYKVNVFGLWMMLRVHGLSGRSARARLTSSFGSDIQALLPGKRLAWPARSWIDHLISVIWESLQITPEFKNQVILSDVGSRSERGVITIGQDTYRGPSFTGDDMFGERLEYSWAVAARDILSTLMGLDFDRIDVEKP